MLLASRIESRGGFLRSRNRLAFAEQRKGGYIEMRYGNVFNGWLHYCAAFAHLNKCMYVETPEAARTQYVVSGYNAQNNRTRTMRLEANILRANGGRAQQSCGWWWVCTYDLQLQKDFYCALRTACKYFYAVLRGEEHLCGVHYWVAWLQPLRS